MKTAIAKDLGSFRESALRLLRADTSYREVEWSRPEDRQPSLWSGRNVTKLPPASPRLELKVPREYVELCRAVTCHRDAKSFATLYELLWRIKHGEPNLLRVQSDPAVRRAMVFEKQIRRDAHKMKAFVRFRKIESDGAERFVAWHKSDHFVLRRVGSFFADRFSTMDWTIFTPDESAHWDPLSARLAYGPGAPRDAAPKTDELEALWCTYYKSIFNPARVKVSAMKNEMPVRYWKEMPETKLIPELLASAASRVETMVAKSKRVPLPVVRSLTSGFEAITGCDVCEHACRATQPVFGAGPSSAKIMLVGEQPGDEEDKQGRPFVGPAGLVLSNALEDAGLKDGEVYKTNAVKHFRWKPGEKGRIHQRPTRGHIEHCRPWLHLELELIRPEVVVCLGGTAAYSVLGKRLSLRESRSKIYEGFGGGEALATYHPAAVLRAKGTEQTTIYQAIVDDLRLAAHRRTIGPQSRDLRSSPAVKLA